MPNPNPNTWSLQEYTVLKVNHGVVELEELGTGRRTVKHASLLKPMPQQVPADDEHVPSPSPRTKQLTAALQTLGPYWVLPAQPDGSCLFRALAMGLDALGGIPPAHVTDNAATAQALRNKLLVHSKLWLQSLPAEELSRVEMQLQVEMADDRGWRAPPVWSWDAYHDYMSQPDKFATYHMISCFARCEGVSVLVFQQIQGELQLVWTERADAADKRDPIRVLRHGVHYDLLVLRPSPVLHAPRKRLFGKHPAEQAKRHKP